MQELFRLNECYTLDTDACDKLVGRTLLHEHPEGQTKNMGYRYRSLHKAERAYDTAPEESLTVV